MFDSILSILCLRFEQIQTYYNDITRDNLDLIKSLKEDIAEQRQRQKKSEQSMYVCICMRYTTSFCAFLYVIFTMLHILHFVGMS